MYTKPCDGHFFIDFIEKLYQFEVNSVIERKCFFRDFYFYDFRFKRDEVHGMEKVCGWDFKAETLYSQRCQYTVNSFFFLSLDYYKNELY